MKPLAAILSVMLTAPGAARNVQITSSGTVVATQSPGGLLVQRVGDVTATELPRSRQF